MKNLTNPKKAEVALKNLKAHGYVNIPRIFKTDTISKVKLIADDLLSKKTDPLHDDVKKSKNSGRSYMHSPKKNNNGVLASPMLGQTDYLDQFANQLFEQPVIKKIISEIVGDDFKIYTISIRSIDPQCVPLGLHQDNFGSLTMSIPLQPITKNNSTTVFIPGTHLLSKCISNKLFWMPLFFFKPFLKYHRCEAGDVGFFFNKTFHGVDIKSDYSTAILINLVAAGFGWSPWDLPKDNNYGKPFKKMLGNCISNGMNPVGHITQNGNNFFSKKFSAKNSKSKIEMTTSFNGDSGRNHTHIYNESDNKTGSYLQLLGENSLDGALSRREAPALIIMLLFISSIRENLKTPVRLLRNLFSKKC